ncbi:MAG TPA: MoaD/ThiS family protein [Pseudonocardiaceae bacterium]|nr:MoaD/ThiS family protein [Pseudonocardiaceae bacterium]
MAELTVRYFAGARAAAGTESETVPVHPGRSTVDDIVRELGERHGPDLAKVLAACSYLLNEAAVRDPATVLPANATLDILPPFAGG